MSDRKPPKWIAPLPPGHHLDGVAPRYGIAQKLIDKSEKPSTRAAAEPASRAPAPAPVRPGIAPPARPAPPTRPAGHPIAQASAVGMAPPLAAQRPTGPRGTGDSMQARRERLVRDLAARGLQDAAVLGALRSIPRDAFVDAALASRAYDDSALPIGHEQTISQPFTVGRMLELMRNGRAPAQRLERVLEVGTGCGYQAAVLGQLAEMVFSIERIRALHELARTRLRPLRLANVRLHFGDGRVGLPHEGPFDGIVIAAAGFELPQALLDQLRLGGRLVAPVARGDGRQRLVVIDRTARNEWQRAEADDVHFVPLRSGTT
ncbi:protein-L-isoaspartate(D-aspartate) O-methyltransferase [Derxia lacustris]|uniref:protein-L-isoaspartate(D-aspartate) O-methyltransferase n=1 Tax=Derxia lacustris TaxID=764842 RepID=UPI000A1727D5|nr:protein-L-isoaspartate(D-aspartate) O-methyltransferase [Derxia lacustris]